MSPKPLPVVSSSPHLNYSWKCRSYYKYFLINIRIRTKIKEDLWVYVKYMIPLLIVMGKWLEAKFGLTIVDQKLADTCTVWWDWENFSMQLNKFCDWCLEIIFVPLVTSSNKDSKISLCFITSNVRSIKL